ncbi:hypothetical protein [Thermococcus litoralis]|nr:hypothetical protein [Thermococcus litoralis]
MSEKVRIGFYALTSCYGSDLLPALKGEGSNELTPRQCGEV